MGFPILKVNKGKKLGSIIAFKALWILALIILSPIAARAQSVILQQLDQSASQTNCNNNVCRQNIGGGLQGTIDQIKLQGTRNVTNQTNYGAIWEWANAYDGNIGTLSSQMATSTTCGLQAGQTNGNGDPQTITQPTYTSTNTQTWTSTNGIKTYTFSPAVTIKPQCYYWIGTSDQTGGGINILGSATSTAYETSALDLVGGSAVKDLYFIVEGELGSELTRIISFNPPDGSTQATSSVTFDILAYINPDDVGNILGVNISLHNIDQNALGWLLGDFSPRDFYIVNERVEVPGFFSAATSTPLPVGNYRVEACLERSYFFGWITNPFANIIEDETDCQSNQFVVGTSTFIGSLTQNGFSEYNDFVTGFNATSTEALAATCNPINSQFGIRECLTYLFIPGGDALNNTLQGLREGILTRVPWGYFTRAVTLFSTNATSSLPVFTTSIRVGAADYEELTFDPGDMIAGAGVLVDSIEDPLYGMNLRDIFYTIIQLIVALGVIMTIFADITKSHEHVKGHNNRE